jgi:hypothetical protein
MSAQRSGKLLTAQVKHGSQTEKCRALLFWLAVALLGGRQPPPARVEASLTSLAVCFVMSTRRPFSTQAGFVARAEDDIP